MAQSFIAQVKHKYKKEVRAELKVMFDRKLAKAVALGVKRAMAKRDRGKTIIDWDIVRECFKAQLSVEQVASVMGISPAGFYAKFAEDNPGEKFGDYREKYQQLGKASLMKELMDRALSSKGFAPLKFALQNHLGMTDRTKVENSFDLAGEMDLAEKKLNDCNTTVLNGRILDDNVSEHDIEEIDPVLDDEVSDSGF